MEALVGLKKAITCTICLDVYQDPVTLGTCRHSFCRECAEGLAQFRDTCPICVVKFKIADMVPLQGLNRIIDAAKGFVHEALLLNDPKYQAVHAAPSSSSVKPKPQDAVFEKGELVEVQARTWAGINKPGGAARVVSFSADEGTYEVKYVLTGTKEKGVLPLYMNAFSLHAAPPDRKRLRGMNNFCL